jgi:hypothetical protein
MGATSADRLLSLPVRLHGIQLGRPTDVLLDAHHWRVLGFEVICADESRRFLPFATAVIRQDELAVRSALMLLAETDFYRARSRSFRSLRDSPLDLGGEKVELRDLLLESDGSVAELVVVRAGIEDRVSSELASVRHAAA